MNKELLEQRERELRNEYPDMFDTPDLEIDEVCLGVIMVDAAEIQASLYNSKGLKTARVGVTDLFPNESGITYRAIIVKLKEYLELDERYRQSSLSPG